MTQQVWKKGRIMLAGLFSVAMLTLIGLSGCGTSGYDNPSTEAVTTKTATALIQAADLKQWADAGLVNKAGGYDRVVILDISGNAADGSNAYDTVGHIPGAQLISAGSNAFKAERAEGPLNKNGEMVCNGATIDALIQNAGIDGNTTIVLTSNAANATGAINVSRAYATFRYWGFPKNRLKVLDGGNAGWTAAGYALSTFVPSIQKSSYGVAQNGTTNINTDMRVSLNEMIAYVTGIAAGNMNKVTIIDTVRGSATVLNSKISGPTADLITTTGFTPFDGAIKGSYSYFAPRMLTSGMYFKDAATIKADVSAAFGTDGVTALGDANRDATKTFISLCRAGNYASIGYFVLDGIAYYDSSIDVKWYDGSLGQWNLMASSDHLALNGSNAGGKLHVGSIWDTTSLMDNLTWNVDRGKTIIDYTSRVYGVEPSFAEAEGNQLETTDKAYRSTVSGSTAGATAGGGGGC
jgi:3-mercaptopyruvate sulfurtransferase SseA